MPPTTPPPVAADPTSSPPLVGYALPDARAERIWNAARLGIGLWAAAVILRHLFYVVYLVSNGGFRPSAALAQTALECVALVLVGLGALLSREMLIAGLFTFLAAVLMGVVLLVLDMPFTRKANVSMLSWRFFGSVASAAPGVLGLLVAWAARRR